MAHEGQVRVKDEGDVAAGHVAHFSFSSLSSRSRSRPPQRSGRPSDSLAPAKRLAPACSLAPMRPLAARNSLAPGAHWLLLSTPNPVAKSAWG